MIIDTSILLAIYFKEAHCDWAIAQLEQHRNELYMSTVNLSELLIHLEQRQPKQFDKLQTQLLDSDITFIPPNINQAQIAAAARLRFPLNLGDCFVYALAVEMNDAILSLDKDFKNTDRTVVFPSLGIN